MCILKPLGNLIFGGFPLQPAPALASRFPGADVTWCDLIKTFSFNLELNIPFKMPPFEIGCPDNLFFGLVAKPKPLTANIISLI